MTRENAIEALVASGKSRAQAEAFLDLLGSGLRRRGWAPGEPLSEDEIRDRTEVLFGDEGD